MTITEIKKRNKAAGFYHFSKEAMKFWNSHVCSKVWKDKYFVISKDNYNRTEILYTIREFHPDTGDITTVQPFQGYVTKEDAIAAMKKL